MLKTLLSAVVAFSLLWSAEAWAADPPNTAEMTNSELQGVSCLGTGAVSATTTTVLVILSPLEALTLPVIAAAFAAGCGVGAVAAPGVAWISRRVGFQAPESASMLQASR